MSGPTGKTILIVSLLLLLVASEPPAHPLDAVVVGYYPAGLTAAQKDALEQGLVDFVGAMNTTNILSTFEPFDVVYGGATNRWRIGWMTKSQYAAMGLPVSISAIRQKINYSSVSNFVKVVVVPYPTAPVTYITNTWNATWVENP